MAHPALASEPLSVVVEESLAAVFAPAVRERVVDEALRLAELSAVPGDPLALRVFLEGPLFTALTRHLSVADAVEITDQIRSVLALALGRSERAPSSGVRSRVSLAALAPPSRVVVVTAASLVVFLLGDMLGESTDVIPCTDQATLRDRLRRLRGQSLLVVVDRKHPSVDLGVCGLLTEELDSSSMVMWWSPDPYEVKEAHRRLEGGPRVVPVAPGLTLASLGEACQRLVQAS